MRHYVIKYDGDISRGEYSILYTKEYDFHNSEFMVFDSYNYITEQINKVGFYKTFENALIVDIEFDYNKLIKQKRDEWNIKVFERIIKAIAPHTRYLKVDKIFG